MENVSVQMEWALPFSPVFSFPCSKSWAIHWCCRLYRLWGLFPERVVSQLLTSAHAVEQTMGYYYWMVRALSHCCCLHHMAPLLTGKHLQFCCDKLSAVPSINPVDVSCFVQYSTTSQWELIMLLGFHTKLLTHSPDFRCSAFGPLPPTPTKKFFLPS